MASLTHSMDMSLNELWEMVMDREAWCAAIQISQARILDRLPLSSPGDPPNSGIEPWSLALQADSLPSELPQELSETVSRSVVSSSDPVDSTQN